MGGWARRVSAGACVLAAVLAVAGCGRGSSRVSPAAGRRPHAAETRAGGPAAVTAFWLFRSGVGLAGLTAPGGAGHAVLAETTDFGAAFRVISPPTARYTVVDDIWALSRSLIWFDTTSTVTTGERLYWTSDGGRSWRSAPAPGHSLNAGATSWIQFTTARRGWLTVQEPTGPGAVLYRTGDGGLTWHRVAAGIGPGAALREVAPVEADPAGGLWQAGASFSGRLEHSADGGRRWRALNLTGAPAPSPAGVIPQPWYALPVFFPHLMLEAVAVPRGTSEDLEIFASRDLGSAWVRVSGLRLPGPVSPLDGADEPLQVALASPRAWWVLIPGRHPRLFRSTGAGRSWRPVRLPAIAQAWDLAAADARHAWLNVTAASGTSAIAVTDDGGHTWHLIVFRRPLQP